MFFGELASRGERGKPGPMDAWNRRRFQEGEAFFTKEELVRLLKTCSGATFADHRDHARLHRHRASDVRPGRAAVRPRRRVRERCLPGPSGGTIFASKAETRP